MLNDGCLMLADANDDEDLNILDIVSMVNCITGNNICNDCSDVNSDLIINIQDIVILVNIILNN